MASWVPAEPHSEYFEWSLLDAGGDLAYVVAVHAGGTIDWPVPEIVAESSGRW